MEDDLKKKKEKNGRRPKKNEKKWRQQKNKMENDLNKNGRWQKST